MSVSLFTREVSKVKKFEQVHMVGGGGYHVVGGLHVVGGGCSTSIDWQAFLFYLFVADERKCYWDVSFKNCANGIADFWSVGGAALTFTTVSFYSRGFKHNFPVIKSTILTQNTLLPYNGEHIKQFPNLHSTQKVRMTHIKKPSPLTWPSVVIFGHRHIFCGKVCFQSCQSFCQAVCSQSVSPCDHTWTCSNLFTWWPPWLLTHMGTP